MGKAGTLPDRQRAVLVRLPDGGYRVEAVRWSAPIGCRLWKRTPSFPDYPIEGTDAEEMLKAMQEWDAWLALEHDLAQGKKARTSKKR